MKKYMLWHFCRIVFCCVLLVGCATTGNVQYKTNLKPYTINGKTYYPMASAKGFSETGTASWYGPKFHGKKTACGERYNQYAMTAAHKTLPFGTRVRVVNLDNNKTTTVVINDRGPFVSGRIIDLSRAAANKIDMLKTGTARVRIESLDSGGARTSGSVPSTSAGVSNAGKYYVQVGAFSVQDNANVASKKLHQLGYSSVLKKDTNGNYVVLAGSYSNRQKAERERNTLRQSFSGAFVVE